MFLTEQQEPERGISELQKLSGIIKEYHSDDCLDYAKVQETLATIYLMTANLSQAKTHFKKAFKIYEKIWADEPELLKQSIRKFRNYIHKLDFLLGKDYQIFSKINIILRRTKLPAVVFSKSHQKSIFLLYVFHSLISARHSLSLSWVILTVSLLR